MCYVMASRFVFFMGLLSVQTNGSLMPVPSLGLLSSSWFVLANFNLIAFGFLISYSVVFYYYLLEAYLLSIERQKGKGYG